MLFSVSQIHITWDTLILHIWSDTDELEKYRLRETNTIWKITSVPIIVITV